MNQSVSAAAAAALDKDLMSQGAFSIDQYSSIILRG